MRNDYVVYIHKKYIKMVNYFNSKNKELSWSKKELDEFINKMRKK